MQIQPNAFKGADYQPEFDFEPLKDQIQRIRKVMLSGKAMTVAEIKTAIAVPGTMDSEPSISAQLRNLRKEDFGWHIIKRKRRDETRESEYWFEGYKNKTSN